MSQSYIVRTKYKHTTYSALNLNHSHNATRQAYMCFTCRHSKIDIRTVECLNFDFMVLYEYVHAHGSISLPSSILCFVTFIPTRLTEDCEPASNTCWRLEEALVEKIVLATGTKNLPTGVVVGSTVPQPPSAWCLHKTSSTRKEIDPS